MDLNKLNTRKIKKLSLTKLSQLSQQIREFLIKNVSSTGGHIGANLGVIELTIALHFVFDSPKDKLIFDTGHQGYCHKIITGRANKFKTLNSFRGLSRFLTTKESKHDLIEASHAGTSLSIASGLSYYNSLRKSNNYVVPIIGDGSLVEGSAFEGLNFIPSFKSKTIIVLNDNGMAIAPNVGAIKILTGSKDYKLKCKQFFENIGYKYIYVNNGHSIPELINKLKKSKVSNKPVLFHVKTTKGKGLSFSKKHPYKMHFSPPFNLKDGKEDIKNNLTYAELASNQLEKNIKKDKQIIAITPGTPYASFLDNLIHKYPKNVIDVGMAEQHSVLMSCGLALQKLKPVLCVQTTFLQRAYDQLLHDLCYMNLPVTILGTRSGISGLDSPTHHGVYDIPYLRSFPNMKISYPINSIDLTKIIDKRLSNPKGPMIILYPYEAVPDNELLSHKKDFNDYTIFENGTDGLIFCLGNQLINSNKLRSKILKKLNKKFSLVCIRNIKKLNSVKLIKYFGKFKKFIGIEESTLHGGLNSLISEILLENKKKFSLLRFGINDIFIEAGNKDDVTSLINLDHNSIYNSIDPNWFKKL